VSSNEPKISRVVHLRAVGKWTFSLSISLVCLLCLTSPGSFQSKENYLPLLLFSSTAM
jgi:hypothetical protein